jgi:prepilin-type N-terminal cleavage/methylation domain-containing protein
MKAFTLIELLIVIAIILILIAIALPNFLEAQLRAKVSKAKGDSRALMTAMVSYQVDYRQFPLDFAEWVNGGNSPRKSLNLAVGGRMCCWALFTSERLTPGYVLTTPVKYLYPVPFDPFNTQAGWFKVAKYPGELFSVYYMTDYSAKTFTTINVPVRRGKHAFLWSVGPSLIYDGGAQGASYTIEYSPTNGSTSAGGIWTFD